MKHTALDQEIDVLYKSHSAKILAVLTRLFGAHNLDLAEDVMQEAFSQAWHHWQRDGLPDNPSAWLIQTARNKAIDIIRSNKTRVKFAEDLSQQLESEWSLHNTVEQEFEESHIKDDLLRMIFMCSDKSIKAENRIPFILKTLCGFSIAAVARAMILPEETVKKRLQRTRKQLRTHKFVLPENHKLAETMDTVHTVLYLLFNEGFYSSHKEKAIDSIVCQEAIGLASLFLEEPHLVNQDTCGLLALMHFHISRIDARLDTEGFNIPIDQQDRSLWNARYIHTAQQFLSMAKQASVGASKRFYIEANIANEHCTAAHFKDTNWPAIVQHYAELIDTTHSPLARLNQAIAIAYQGEVEKAISIAKDLQTLDTFSKTHLVSSTLAHFYAMQGNADMAYQLAEKAKAQGGTPIEQQLMLTQLERLLAP